MTRKTLSAERLREMLDYDAETGIFVWRKDHGVNVKAGMEAGHVTNKGYRMISLDGFRSVSHRLAWLYVYGAFPSGEVDHINRVKTDNRLCNLREVTRSENQQNTPIQKIITLGTEVFHGMRETKSGGRKSTQTESLFIWATSTLLKTRILHTSRLRQKCTRTTQQHKERSHEQLHHHRGRRGFAADSASLDRPTTPHPGVASSAQLAGQPHHHAGDGLPGVVRPTGERRST